MVEIVGCTSVVNDGRVLGATLVLNRYFTLLCFRDYIFMILVNKKDRNTLLFIIVAIKIGELAYERIVIDFWPSPTFSM